MSAEAPRCLNCAAPLAGPFCAACGQKVQPLRQPLGSFLAESFTEFFGLDGRVWRTARDLAVRPGKLTVDFVEGRRTAALRPFRVYLTATLLFFVTLGLMPNVPTDTPTPAEDAAAFAGPTFPADSMIGVRTASPALDDWVYGMKTQRRALVVAQRVLTDLDSAATARAALAADSLGRREERFTALRDSVRALPDTVRVRAGTVGMATPPGVRPTFDDDESGYFLFGGSFLRAVPDWMKGDLARRVETARTPEEKEAARDAATKAFIGQIPTAFLIVLPIFAVLLKLLYLGGGGIEVRARRRLIPPLPAGASVGERVRAGVQRLGWRLRQARARRQVRARIRTARRPWRRAARRLRARLPARIRATRFGWLRRAARGRRTRYYAEHIVFTLHVHAFLFLAFWVLLLLTRVDAPGALGGLVIATVPAYFVLAQRRVYAQTWGKTLVKSTILGVMYFTVIVVATVGTAALAARLG